MAESKLMSLSYDLRSLLLSYIIRPGDLKSLCLTCKDLRDIAIRQLYRKVEIDIGSQSDLKLSAFLGRNNPGLPFVRTLILNPDVDTYIPSPRSSPSPPPPPPPPPLIVMGGPPPPPPPMQAPPGRREPSVVIESRRWNPAHFTVSILLELLPENILEKFQWTSYDEFSADNFVLLCKKQRKLSCIEVGPMDMCLLQALDKEPEVLKNLHDLHALDLYPDNADCLQTCAKMLECAPKLDELWIESCFPPHRGAPPEDEPNHEDESNKPGLITSTLFRGRLPFQTCTPMTLKYLSLGKIDLRWAAQTYMKVVKFPSLEHLEVRSCPGSDALFAEMTKPAKQPVNLKSLKFSHLEDGRHYALSALENFLRAISSLTELYLSFTGLHPLPKIDAVCKQGEKLRTLIVQSTSPGVGATWPAYSKDEVKRLCKDCANLEQLAIAFPPTAVLEERVSPRFGEFATTLFALRRLTTLSITSWPERSLGSGFDAPTWQGTLSMDVYIYEIRRIAQWVFDRKTEYAEKHEVASRLRVVAFGGTPKLATVSGVSGTLPQLAYMQGQLIDPFGLRSTVALPVKPALVKYAEPDSEILTCAFGHIPIIFYE
ncbi:MAG: hypothetical protein M1838_004329 [Thelocarpon superellum]|nr:MAG: hypothetical protein M1838_004329 [Thelocarpon superellum]